MTTEQTHTEIQNELERVCKATGRYERGGTHEPTSAPGRGLTYAIFMAEEFPIPSSGLNSTSTCLVWTVQSRLSITYKPADQIDIKLSGAARDLARRFSNRYRMGVAGVRSIDVRGANGVALRWRMGYLNQDNVWFRVCDLSVPVLINDAWPEAEGD